ncbi:MAG TPA: HIT domain-containing protein [Patescibacteria group bacterium]|nr:HIT domain-containing protein [Patescibacteria group bacterium]
MPKRNEACVFCRIAARKLPATHYYETKDVIAIKNIHPFTPVHVLIVPTKHIAEITSLEDEDIRTVKEMMFVIKKLVRDFQLDTKGYRVVINGGGAQEIQHLHLHLMGPVAVDRAM